MIEGGGPCGLCGRDPSAGFASVWEADDQIWLCHDLPADKVSCYVKWTVYGVRKPDDWKPAKDTTLGRKGDATDG